MNASKNDLEQRIVRVLITGRVQGVAYRAWTERAAMARGLNGWVRNRRDGAVEALFSGSRADVDDMLRRCREGPPAARVQKVSVIEEGGTAPLGFAILSTA
jgi:acylphosphatase